MSAVNPCRSRFRRPIFLWALAGLITEAVLQTVAHAGLIAHGMQWLRLVSLVPEAFFLVALIRTVMKMDELQRQITLMSIAMAFILTLAFTLVLAALQEAGIDCSGLRNEVGTFMLLFWGVSYLVSARRYR